MTERKKALANRDVSFKEIIYDFVKNWRRLLVVMISMAVIAAGFSYAKSICNEKVAAQEDIEIVLAYPNLSAEDEAKILRTLYEMPIEDLCALMDIDKQMDVQLAVAALSLYYADSADVSSSFPSGAVPVAELVYNISNVSESDARAVAYLFAQIMDMPFVAQKMELMTGISWPYYNAYSVEVGDTVLGNTNAITFVLMSNGNELLNTYVELLKNVIQLVDEMVRKEVGNFSMSLVSETIYNSSDASIFRKQFSNLLEEKDNIIYYLTMANSFNTFQTVYYNRLSPLWTKADYVDDLAKAYFVEQVETSSVKKAAIEISARLNKKLILLAVAVGVGLCAFISLAGQVFGNRLRSNDRPEDIFGMREIARIHLVKKEKHLFSKYDVFLYRLFHAKVAKQNEDYVISKVCAALDMVSGDVTIAINDLSVNQESWLKKICNDASKEGNKVRIVNNYLYDKDAYTEFRLSDKVILVGNVGSTLYDDIFEEIDLISDMKKTILGIIVFET